MNLRNLAERLTRVFLIIALVACRTSATPRPALAPAVEDPALSIADSVRALYLVAGRAVLDSALVAAPDTAPVCVSFVRGRTHYRPELSDLRRLADPHRRYIPRTQCPRTYASMIALVDSLGRVVDHAPRGYVDPHYLQLVLPGEWTNDRLDIDVAIGQGTRIDKYLCFTRFTAGVPVAACRHVSTSIS